MNLYVICALFIHVTMINAFMETASTTVQIQNFDGPIYIGETQSLTCDNRLPPSTNYSPSCDKHHKDKPSTSQVCDKQYPSYENQYPTLTSLGSPQILHHATSDCNCVTKHQTSCVPVNNVPQYSCTPYYAYPEGYYGYVYPDVRTCHPEDASSPKISENLIPILKTYLAQNGSKTKCQQCGQNHSYY